MHLIQKIDVNGKKKNNDVIKRNAFLIVIL